LFDRAGIPEKSIVLGAPVGAVTVVMKGEMMVKEVGAFQVLFVTP
jgi:hypothetical protein